tara:strand:- start:83 stop:295 length:213 start_codon:yes stop_codon:yes gene_type:complete
MSKDIKFKTYYSPFSYDEPGEICTEIRVYVDGKLEEKLEYNDILNDKQVKDIMNKKLKDYGVSGLSEGNN